MYKGNHVKKARCYQFSYLTQEKLNSKNAKELIGLLQQSESHGFNMGMALMDHTKDCDVTWEEVGKIRVQIVKTLWKNFPREAKRRGLKKFN
tara:strand:- start:1177 stop:1452 length:276 start_codon:yes stop_codon:yes gene_type:complete